MAIEVQLLGTLGCHLCEQAEQLLMPWLARDVVVELLDIAESEVLVARYGLRIPVLRRERDGAELGWPFDERSLAAFLQGG